MHPATGPFKSKKFNSGLIMRKLPDLWLQRVSGIFLIGPPFRFEVIIADNGNGDGIRVPQPVTLCFRWLSHSSAGGGWAKSAHGHDSAGISGPHPMFVRRRE
jgi:hypothetical protein